MAAFMQKRQLFAESRGVTDAPMLVSMCASVMYKWGMWELFFCNLFIYFKDQDVVEMQLSALKQ